MANQVKILLLFRNKYANVVTSVIVASLCIGVRTDPMHLEVVSAIVFCVCDNDCVRLVTV